MTRIEAQLTTPQQGAGVAAASPKRQGRPRLFASLLLLLALIFVAGGGYLVALGGSPYYLLAGATLALCGGLLWRGDRRGVWLYGLLCLGTCLWAVWEVGFDVWALVPRIVAPLVLGIWLILPWTLRSVGIELPSRRLRRAYAALIGVVLLAGVLAFGNMNFSRDDDVAVAGAGAAPSDSFAASEWHAYGKDGRGNRYVPVTQINRANVKNLEVAWTHRNGDRPGSPWMYEVTPLKVGGRLFICTPQRRVIAIDADTGRELWRFSPTMDTIAAQVPFTCRGVSYHEDAAEGDRMCARRILATSRNGEFWALDAATGKPCPDFGRGGKVSLLEGIRRTATHDTMSTSPGVVIGQLIVFGTQVVDAKSIEAPSGVIRAYDVRTGQLAWAWDMGRPDRSGLPPKGETYTPSTPNAWPPLSADEKLGLIYVPLGNPSTDFYGALRRPFDEKYGTSLVALDVKTGRPRWSFQAVHHDLWDLDLPAQPILYDLRTKGGLVPAVIQLSKTGDIYILDRRTGKPIVPVTEVPVPQKGGVPDDWLSPTQPRSALSFPLPRLTEADMWGVTPIDQLICRIGFRSARHEGPFTPPGASMAIGYPSSSGTFSWGGATIDPRTDILYVNMSYMPYLTKLIPRKSEQEGNTEFGGGGLEGTPYKIFTAPMLSPLGIPCKRPPWGEFMALNLRSGKVLWRKPFGTGRDNGPFGIPVMLPLPTTTPNIGGNVLTQAGLIFIGATTDRYLRAFDVRDGRELWRASLPAGANATPMTYISQASGRQFIVVAAGGHAGLGTRNGDYLVAFALPKEPKPRR